MAWLAFTKSAQARNIALLEIKQLLKTLEMTSGVPESFWREPYPVGFVSGYVLGTWLYMVGKNIEAAAVSKTFYDVLGELAPDKVLDVAQRFASWKEKKNSDLSEGETNGATLALFLLGQKNAVDNKPVVIEARRKSKEMPAFFDNLQIEADEEGKVGIVLRMNVFYDRMKQFE